MSDLISLSEVQMQRIEAYFPLLQGIPPVDDRRIVSAIIFVIRNGQRGRDAPEDYGPHRPSITASSTGAGCECFTSYGARCRVLQRDGRSR
jgi:transposase